MKEYDSSLSIIDIHNFERGNLIVSTSGGNAKSLILFDEKNGLSYDDVKRATYLPVHIREE